MDRRALGIANIVVALGATWSPPSRAEVTAGESLDWLAVSHPHIAIARVVGVVDEPRSDGYVRTTSADTETTLKGRPPARPSIERYVPLGGPAHEGRTWSLVAHRGDRLLVFLGAGRAAEHAINLEEPATRGWQDVAFTTTFEVLEDGARILEVVERRLQRVRTASADGEAAMVQSSPGARASNVFTPQRGFLRLEVPGASDAHRALCGLSACYLVVPADPEHRAGIITATRSDDVYERAAAASQLLSYPDAESLTVLRELLADPGEVEQTRHHTDGRIEKRSLYLVREAAREVLRSLGAEPGTPGSD